MLIRHTIVLMTLLKKEMLLTHLPQEMENIFSSNSRFNHRYFFSPMNFLKDFINTAQKKKLQIIKFLKNIN